MTDRPYRGLATSRTDPPAREGDECLVTLIHIVSTFHQPRVGVTVNQRCFAGYPCLGISKQQQPRSSRSVLASCAANTLLDSE